MPASSDMFSWFKWKRRSEEKLKSEDVAAVSRLLLPPEPTEEEELAYHPEDTILREDVAMNRAPASGAGTSGGFGSYQPFLSQEEIDRREQPGSWEHDESKDTDAPRRPVSRDEVRELERQLKGGR